MATQPITTEYAAATIIEEKIHPDSKGSTELDVVDVEKGVPQLSKIADDGREPTEEELATLRKVAAPMPKVAIAMCLIEFAERASYYGSSGPFSNFIQQPLPIGGSGTGAVAPGPQGVNEHAGALNLGLETAQALTTLFTFLAYTVPIFGGIIADTKWGRFKTICIGTAVGAVAHVLLVIPAIPSVIASGHALAPFIISILILAFAAGFIKPSLGPLLCDQCPVDRQVIKTLKSGEKVIVDPALTISRYLLIFYWCINIGAFFQLATTEAERTVGFWLAYLLPGIIYMILPPVLWYGYYHLRKFGPQGSVVMEGLRVIKACLSNGGWKSALKGGDSFWDRAKPSVIEADAEKSKKDLSRITWDDQFVDELRRSISACKIFLLIPIFAIADGGFGSVQTSQAASMTANGVPNDLIANFNPLTIVVCAPILNFIIYPTLRKWGWVPSAMARMSFGFMLAALAMVIGALLQWRVYHTSPCGFQATNCDEPSPISLWWQIPIYSFPAIGELFVNVTSYEIAYTRAPARMKTLVYAFALFSSALSSALLEIINPVMNDPNLIWPFVASAISCTLCAIALPIFFSDVKKEYQHLDLGHKRMDGIKGDQSK